MFYLQQRRYVRFCMAQQSFLPFNSFTAYPRKNVTTLTSIIPQSYLNAIILTSISFIAFVKEWPYIGSENFWHPLSIIISKLSTINEYFKIPTFFIDPISPGKSNKFPIPSISIPSSSPWTVKTLFDWRVSSSMKMWFSSKIKLERSLFVKEISYILFHVILSLCFASSVKTFVNKVNDWLIKTNNFLISKFIFVLKDTHREKAP